MPFEFDWRISVGNVITIATFVGAAWLALSRHLEAIRSIKDGSVRQERTLVKLEKFVEEQVHLNASVDKRLALIEDREDR